MSREACEKRRERTLTFGAKDSVSVTSPAGEDAVKPNARQAGESFVCGTTNAHFCIAKTLH